MSNLDSIASVNIAIQNTTVSSAGFGYPLFLGQTLNGDRTKLTSRVESFKNLTEVGAVFASTDPEYQMAQACFAQDIAPAKVYIGKKYNLTSIAITSASQVSGQLIAVTKTDHGLESGLSLTISGFTTTEYNGTFEITVIDDNTFEYTATATVTNATATGSGVYTISEDWAQGTTECISFSQDWYAMAISSHVKADILAVAGVVETSKKLFICRSSEIANLVSSNTLSTLYALKNANYSRTACLYTSTASTNYVDCALLGAKLPKDAGSTTWNYTQLKGVTVESLTTLQETNLTANNGNFFGKVANLNVVRNGLVASGEYIDVIRGIDWLENDIQVSMVELLVSSDKIPYSDTGAAIIKEKLINSLEKGVQRNFIGVNSSGEGDYTISSLAIEDIPSADKLSRKYSGVSFTAKLASAVHSLEITGSVYN